MKAKLIECATTLDLHHFDGTLDEAGLKIHELKEKYGPEARLDMEFVDYETYDLVVRYKRPETPEEATARRKRERQAREKAKKAKQTAQHREIITLKRLLKKHGVPT